MSVAIDVKTPRLILRQWRPEDRVPFAALNADPAVTQFLLPLTRAESDALADRLARSIDEQGWGFWAVEVPGVAPFIGFVGIKPMPAALPIAPGIEIGWRLARAHWGNGYALEAAQASLRVGFEQARLPEIVAFTALGNVRSRAVMERLGMQEDSEQFDHPALTSGHPLRRHVLYRLSQDAWQSGQTKSCLKGSDADTRTVIVT